MELESTRKNFKLEINFHAHIYSKQLIQITSKLADTRKNRLPSHYHYHGVAVIYMRWPLYAASKQEVPDYDILKKKFTGKVENLHAHVNRNLQHANPNLHVL